MSKPAEAPTIRLARPDEREALEALQWRASLANESHGANLEANRLALGFYEKSGFAREGEAQTRFGPAIRMSR
jgi:hypothetical protein